MDNDANMSTEFKIPELGENVSAGDVVRVLVKAGDQLAKDQPVLELETDKATIEVPSNVAGTVKEIKVKAGDKVKVGQLVLTLDASGAEGAEKAEDAEKEIKSKLRDALAQLSDTYKKNVSKPEDPLTDDKVKALKGKATELSASLKNKQ